MLKFSKFTLLALTFLHCLPAFGLSKDLVDYYFNNVSLGIRSIDQKQLETFFSRINSDCNKNNINQKEVIQALIIRCDEKIEYFGSLKTNNNYKKIALKVGGSIVATALTTLAIKQVKTYFENDLSRDLNILEQQKIEIVSTLTDKNMIDEVNRDYSVRVVGVKLFHEMRKLVLPTNLLVLGYISAAGLIGSSINDFWDYKHAGEYYDKYCFVKEALQQQLA